MELYNAQNSFIIGDFNAKDWKKSVEMAALRNFEIDTRNDRCDIVVGIA